MSIITLTETMAVLAQTCKIALPARVAARAGKTARRTGIVAKAAAPVDAVRVQQKVRVGCKNCAIHISSREARNREAWHRGVRGVASKAHPVCGVCDVRSVVCSMCGVCVVCVVYVVCMVCMVCSES